MRTPPLSAFLIVLITLLQGCPRDSPPSYEAVYSETREGPLHAYVFTPQTDAIVPSGVVLLFHGGGWSAGSPQSTFPKARYFASLGLTALAIEYRLSNQTNTPADAIADVCAALAWVQQHASALKIDPNHIVAYGESAGGHLVAVAATVGCSVFSATDAQPPAALMLMSPALEVAEMAYFIQLTQGKGPPTDYSPLHHITHATPPTIILHGSDDLITPKTGGDMYCGLMKDLENYCELHIYEGAGHMLVKTGTAKVDNEDSLSAMKKLTSFMFRMGMLSTDQGS